MGYQVIVPRPVQKQLDDLPGSVRERVIVRVMELKDNPRPHGCVKLKGYEHEYRIRIGDYRVRYEVRDEEAIVLLLHCAHRKDVYRELSKATCERPHTICAVAFSLPNGSAGLW